MEAWVRVNLCDEHREFKPKDWLKPCLYLKYTNDKFDMCNHNRCHKMAVLSYIIDVPLVFKEENNETQRS